MNIINGSNDDNNNDGVRGKFRDRLRLIKINRYKAIIKSKTNDNIIINRGNVRIAKSRIVVRKNVSISFFNNARKKIVKYILNGNDKLFLRGVLNRVRATRSDRDYGIRRVGVIKEAKAVKQDLEKKRLQEEKRELEKKITRKMKDEINKASASAEILEEESQNIENKNKENKSIEGARKLRKDSSDLKDRVNDLIKEYNLADDYDILDDYSGDLADDIIRYKEIIDKLDNTADVDRSIVDKYRDIYFNLVKLRDDNDKVATQIDAQEEEFGRRNEETRVDFEKVNFELLKCDKEIMRQNNNLNYVINNVNNIGNDIRVNTKLVGLNSLLSSSAFYVGTLMVSPVLGFVPSIIIDTLATRRMIRNIYSYMVSEKKEREVYVPDSYDKMINQGLDNVDDAYVLLDDTRGMLDRLRHDYLSNYNDSMVGFREGLQKIEEMRDSIDKNRYKMDMIKNKLIVNKKLVDNQKKKVLKMND